MKMFFFSYSTLSYVLSSCNLSPLTPHCKLHMFLQYCLFPTIRYFVRTNKYTAILNTSTKHIIMQEGANFTFAIYHDIRKNETFQIIVA